MLRSGMKALDAICNIYGNKQYISKYFFHLMWNVRMYSKQPSPKSILREEGEGIRIFNFVFLKNFFHIDETFIDF